MSEYQYYEWQAIDRPLNADEMAEVEGLSSHMETVTPSQAIVTYSYGDFKYEPEEVLLKYFDAFLYLANWGSRQLMFRFPIASVSIYDEAVGLLGRLRDLAEYQDRLDAFRVRMDGLAGRYARSSSLLKRMRNAGLIAW